MGSLHCFFSRRDPKSLVKPPRNKSENFEQTDDCKEELKKKTPTASRHLILIRHGQYDMDPDSDKGRILTALGKVGVSQQSRTPPDFFFASILVLHCAHFGQPLHIN